MMWLVLLSSSAVLWQPLVIFTSLDGPCADSRCWESRLSAELSFWILSPVFLIGFGVCSFFGVYVSLPLFVVPLVLLLIYLFWLKKKKLFCSILKTY
ncbi:hypothetical protein KFK09_002965 [Dendrobium nobile]|uniref:Uncharacterized protein n=1 Tax=Dendrobium nobile TaxID=94219 RepID=A0A8T3C6D2_DENNO|nr:hypothetical protein KFK09_002965 [Dendrobium nobile]